MSAFSPRLINTACFAIALLSANPAYAAIINDISPDADGIAQFQGQTQTLNTTLVNPYSNQTVSINQTLNINTGRYIGNNSSSPFTRIIMTNQADALFLEDLDSGQQTVFDINFIVAQDDKDIINFASSTIDYVASNTGASFNIIMNGGFEDDILWGNAGDDSIAAASGNDNLDGGPGNDVLYGDDGDDVIYGGAGDDELYGDRSGLSIFNVGNDTVFGGEGNDLIGGGYGNDILNGDEGDDTIFGEIGDDAIFGGSGNDKVLYDRFFGDFVWEVLSSSQGYSFFDTTGIYGTDELYGIETVQFSDGVFSDGTFAYTKEARIPVPSTVWLFLVALALIATLAYRKKRASLGGVVSVG